MEQAVRIAARECGEILCHAPGLADVGLEQDMGNVTQRASGGVERGPVEVEPHHGEVAAGLALDRAVEALEQGAVAATHVRDMAQRMAFAGLGLQQRDENLFHVGEEAVVLEAARDDVEVAVDVALAVVAAGHDVVAIAEQHVRHAAEQRPVGGRDPAVQRTADHELARAAQDEIAILDLGPIAPHEALADRLDRRNRLRIALGECGGELALGETDQHGQQEAAIEQRAAFRIIVPGPVGVVQPAGQDGAAGLPRDQLGRGIAIDFDNASGIVGQRPVARRWAVAVRLAHQGALVAQQVQRDLHGAGVGVEIGDDVARRHRTFALEMRDHARLLDGDRHGRPDEPVAQPVEDLKHGRTSPGSGRLLVDVVDDALEVGEVLDAFLGRDLDAESLFELQDELDVGQRIPLVDGVGARLVVDLGGVDFHHIGDDRRATLAMTAHVSNSFSRFRFRRPSRPHNSSGSGDSRSPPSRSCRRV